MSIIETHFSEIMDLFKVAPWAMVLIFIAWRYRPILEKAVEAWAKKPSVDIDTIVESAIKRLDARYVQISSCHTHIDRHTEESNISMGLLREDIKGIYDKVGSIEERLFNHVDKGGKE